MPTRKTAPAKRTAPVRRDTTRTAARTTTRTPVKVTRAQVAPHPKTLANGQPRPKKRG